MSDANPGEKPETTATFAAEPGTPAFLLTDEDYGDPPIALWDPDNLPFELVFDPDRRAHENVAAEQHVEEIAKAAPKPKLEHPTKLLPVEIGGKIVEAAAPDEVDPEAIFSTDAPPERFVGKILEYVPTSGPIREYVQYASCLTHAPVFGHLAGALAFSSYVASWFDYQTRSTIATTLRGKALVQFEHPTGLWLWFMLADPSGSGKTTAIRLVQDVTRAVLARQKASVEDRWVPLGTTPERFIRDFAAQITDRDVTPALLTHDEFSKVLENERWIDYLTQAWDGHEVANLTKKEQEAAEKEKREVLEVIRRPRFSLICSSTEAGLSARLTNQAVAGGLAARFVWVPTTDGSERQPFQFSDPTGRENVITQWTEWVDSLTGSSATLHLKRSGKHVIEWRAKTTKAALEFWQSMQKLVGESGEEHDQIITSLAARVMNQAKRVAALYALSRYSTYVELEDFEPASRFVRACFDFAHGEVPKFAQGFFAAKIARVYAALRESGMNGLNKRELFAVLGNSVMKSDLVAILETLHERYHLVSRLRLGKPGRPPQVYWLYEQAPMRRDCEVAVHPVTGQKIADEIDESKKKLS